MKDVFGTAILDYQQGNYTEDLVTSTSISEEDVLPISYLFRDFSEMPALEQTALKLSKGSVLDVGCGAGSHSLYLTSKGLEVKSIDISEGAIKTCQLRGLKNARVLALNHLKTLLNPEGQILIDSSDIKYMYQDEDGGYWMDTNKEYYGELDYTVGYKGEEATFSWMYLDFENLKIACNQAGLKCELIKKGPHFDFLAKLSVS
jgi:SAM-dependent methyltransferase